MIQPEIVGHLSKGCRDTWNNSGMYFVENLQELAEEGFSEKDIESLCRFLNEHPEFLNTIEIDPDFEHPNDALITCYAEFPAHTAKLDIDERRSLLECGNIESLTSAAELALKQSDTGFLDQMKGTDDKTVQQALRSINYGWVPYDQLDLIQRQCVDGSDLDAIRKAIESGWGLDRLCVHPGLAAVTVELAGWNAEELRQGRVAQSILQARADLEKHHPEIKKRIENHEMFLATDRIGLQLVVEDDAFKGIDLTGCAYSLERAIFRGADLTNVKLSSNSLQKANFMHADLTGAEIYHSDVSGANMVGTIMNDAMLHDVIAINANLTQEQLDSCKFANMIYIDDPRDMELQRKLAASHDRDVRIQVAKQGLCLDQLIEDADPFVFEEAEAYLVRNHLTYDQWENAFPERMAFPQGTPAKDMPHTHLSIREVGKQSIDASKALNNPSRTSNMIAREER